MNHESESLSGPEVLCLVTGGTGFVGGHVIQRCLERGFTTRALVRRGSNTRLLDELRGPAGERVHKEVGDLTDPEAVERAVAGVHVIVHCAAKVGDWGELADYRRVNVEALDRLLEAARRQPLHRLVHVSSLGVYEGRHHYGTDERVEPAVRGLDGYTQTKVEAERLVLRSAREHNLPVSVVRPGFIYGPRDRSVMPRLLEALRDKTFMFFGSGKQAMNTIYVENLVDGIFLALDRPEAVGQVYNLTDGQPISKRAFITTVAKLTGYDVPTKSIPLWLARTLGGAMETWARICHSADAPLVNKARIKFLGLNLDFSIDKARRELGYQPRFSFEEGMRRTIESLGFPKGPAPNPHAAAESATGGPSHLIASS